MASRDEIDCWNGDTGRRWAERAEAIDRRLEPFNRLLLDHARPAGGERVLDVGCGAGALTLRLAEAVDSVVGVDVSRPLLRVARERTRDRNNVELIEADVEHHRFAGAPFDHVLSRFGVMFFEETAAGFGSLARSLAPGGELTVACWAAPADNPWASLPRSIAARHVELDGKPGEDLPGPFRLGDPERIERALAPTPFGAPEILAADGTMWIGEGVEAAVDFSLEIGPAAGAVRQEPEARAAIAADLRAALADHLGPDGVRLSYRAWIVRARMDR